MTEVIRFDREENERMVREVFLWGITELASAPIDDVVSDVFRLSADGAGRSVRPPSKEK